MAGIDLLALQPSVISRDLAGKYILLAGEQKIGKTEFCTMCDDVLICATEIGTNAKPGNYVQPITTWSDFKLVCRQLKKPEVKEKFKTVAIDTITILYSLCETFICAQNGVQNISDIPYGAGYVALSKEFESALRDITMMGYALIMTCHLKETQINDDDEKPVYSYKPNLNNRCLSIVNSLVDIIGIITKEWDASGECKRYLITRSTPTIAAGSRFKYLDAKIPFGYKELVDAVGRAIDKEAQKTGSVVVEHAAPIIETSYSYEELRNEAMVLWEKLVKADEKNADRILKKAEIQFGRPIRLSEITEGQEQPYALLVEEMREMAKSL